MKTTFISDNEQKCSDGLRGLRRPMPQEWKMLSHQSLVRYRQIGIPDGILDTRIH